MRNSPLIDLPGRSGAFFLPRPSRTGDDHYAPGLSAADKPGASTSGAGPAKALSMFVAPSLALGFALEFRAGRFAGESCPSLPFSLRISPARAARHGQSLSFALTLDCCRYRSRALSVTFAALEQSAVRQAKLGIFSG